MRYEAVSQNGNDELFVVFFPSFQQNEVVRVTSTFLLLIKNNNTKY